ncbi:sugar kinase [Pseudoprimorskyibacter insulae]|uniref:2-dehydro-3-deoxygluconokinase n=1 Tax=Pseudoprimorskyibacter insulae TaxID=1695997 RepID=A0A2R8AY32_9RHOB|nr:sugar kinase [Pseudoprimorskyibacter insulae]SPF80952.1 2-dehydro-3-deoxygluconokinase [Pseudoprimorskyibacter insulae]
MRFLAIGEAMVELSVAQDGSYQRGFAGDTLNTAWYVRAALGGGAGFMTSIGQDALSDQMLAFIAGAGIDTARIRRHPSRTVGLYMISLNSGERSFSYWRDSSAARTLADDRAGLAAALSGAEMLYFSGITLAILAPVRRMALLEALQTCRNAGATVAFDPNLRPRLWTCTEEMVETINIAAGYADIILPSFDDEAAAFGDQTIEATAQRYASAGAREVMVKNGGGAMCVLSQGQVTHVPAMGAVTPVDTTGAGDSFNGGYLAARLQGISPIDAVRAGHETARRVVMHPGGLVPMETLVA